MRACVGAASSRAAPLRAPTEDEQRLVDGALALMHSMYATAPSDGSGDGAGDGDSVLPAWMCTVAQRKLAHAVEALCAAAAGTDASAQQLEDMVLYVAWRKYVDSGRAPHVDAIVSLAAGAGEHVSAAFMAAPQPGSAADAPVAVRRSDQLPITDRRGTSKWAVLGGVSMSAGELRAACRAAAEGLAAPVAETARRPQRAVVAVAIPLGPLAEHEHAAGNAGRVAMLPVADVRDGRFVALASAGEQRRAAGLICRRAAAGACAVDLYVA